MAPNMGTESEGGFFFKAVDHFQSSVHAACVRANVKKLDVYFAYSVSCNPYHLSYCPKKLSRKMLPYAWLEAQIIQHTSEAEFKIPALTNSG